MNKISLDTLAESLFEFVIVVGNNILKEDEFIKNFPNAPERFQEIMQHYPMPPSHIKVILYLSRVNYASISQIGSILNISKSNMTPIIDKLISYGLVKRYADPKDRRILRIESTEKALELIDNFKLHVKSQLIKKISCFSEEDRIDLKNCIDRLTYLFLKVK